jgi:hypothetical protein
MIRKRKKATMLCVNCIWWTEKNHFAPEESNGICHYKPPIGLLAGIGGYSYWPETYDDDFCGKGLWRANCKESKGAEKR